MNMQGTTSSAEKVAVGLPPVNTESSTGIKVTVHVPEKVPEAVKKRKIDMIYEILSPKTLC